MSSLLELELQDSVYPSEKLLRALSLGAQLSRIQEWPISRQEISDALLGMLERVSYCENMQAETLGAVTLLIDQLFESDEIYQLLPSILALAPASFSMYACYMKLVERVSQEGYYVRSLAEHLSPEEKYPRHSIEDSLGLFQSKTPDERSFAIRSLLASLSDHSASYDTLENEPVLLAFYAALRDPSPKVCCTALVCAREATVGAGALSSIMWRSRGQVPRDLLGEFSRTDHILRSRVDATDSYIHIVSELDPDYSLLEQTPAQYISLAQDIIYSIRERISETLDLLRYGSSTSAYGAIEAALRRCQLSHLLESTNIFFYLEENDPLGTAGDGLLFEYCDVALRKSAISALRRAENLRTLLYSNKFRETVEHIATVYHEFRHVEQFLLFREFSNGAPLNSCHVNPGLAEDILRTSLEELPVELRRGIVLRALASTFADYDPSNPSSDLGPLELRTTYLMELDANIYMLERTLEWIRSLGDRDASLQEVCVRYRCVSGELSDLWEFN